MPCYEFVPLLHAIPAVICLLTGYVIIGFVDGRRKLIALPLLFLGGLLLLSGHQFHCEDGNDYSEREYCQSFLHNVGSAQNVVRFLRLPKEPKREFRQAHATWKINAEGMRQECQGGLVCLR